MRNHVVPKINPHYGFIVNESGTLPLILYREYHEYFYLGQTILSTFNNEGLPISDTHSLFHPLVSLENIYQESKIYTTE